MWSHYSDKHKGICLEFDINNQLLKTAREIIYSAEYPIWHPHEFQKNQSRAIEMVLTKSSQWIYEKEFRITGLLNSPVASYLVPEGDFFHLPPGALRSIIVGCAADYEAIKKIVLEYMPGLPIRKVVRAPNLYRLVIEE